MAEQYPHDQPDARQPDVVVFSPELLKMADAHRQRELSLWHRRRAERYEPGVLLVQPIRTG